MTENSELPVFPVALINLAEELGEERLKRLPPLFYKENEPLEMELLILKLVSKENPNHEVYLYEYDGISLFSAMIVDRGMDSLQLAFDLVMVKANHEAPVFRIVEIFKPRTVNEVIGEAEADGLLIRAVESEDLLEAFGLPEA
jgi:hypothetical protein